MPNKRPKPTDEQIEWFEWAGKEIERLEAEIEAGLRRKDLLHQTLVFIDKNKRGIADSGDEKILTRNQDKQIVATQELMNLAETLRRRRNLSGICPQCGGTGFHGIDLGQRRPLLNEPPRTCNRCWGSGWKKGNKNPFAVPEITKRPSKKTKKSPKRKKE